MLRLKILALVLFSSVSTNAVFADDIDELLRETDSALGNRPKADDRDDDQKDDDKSEPVAPVKKKAAKKSPTAPAPTATSTTTPGTPDPKASQSVLTPTDAESVNELISVGLRREAQLRPNQQLQQLELAVGVARLHGSHELEKDDDTFRVQKGERLSGAALAYSSDIGTRAWNVGRVGGLRPIARLGASYLKGQVAVDRRGVENTRIDPDYNLIPISAGLGVRNSDSQSWRFLAAYGPAIEMLVQTGEGNTDSTSGMFFADALDVSAQKSITEALWLGVTWQVRGLIPVSGDEAGHNLLAITLNTPLAG